MIVQYLDTHYGADEEGNIYNLQNNHILKPYEKDKYGHSTVCINKKAIGVQRIIATCFIPNPNNYPEVDHIDRNPRNNKVSNLRWVSHKMNFENPNTREQIRTSKVGNHNHLGCKHSLEVKQKMSNNRPKRQVVQLSLDGEIIKMWDSAQQAQNETNFSKGNIISCCRGRYKQAYGFIWKYGE